MNFFAKIFVVINLVLSVVFLAVAATLLSQKWDYKMKFEELRQKNSEEKISHEGVVKNLRGQVGQFEKDLKNKDALIREAENRANENEMEYRKRERENKDLKNELSRLNTSIDKISTDIAAKTNRITQLEKDLKRQKDISEEALRQKELAQDEMQRVDINLNNALGQAAEKDKIIAQMQKELWEAKQIIRSVREAGVKIPLLVGKAKPIDGSIQMVSEVVPIVMINKGSDHEVQKGYEFTVYRGGEYIGRVIVEEVYKDASAARIIRDLTTKKIMKGDSVTTRIGGGGK